MYFLRGVTPTAQPIPTLEEKEEKNCITLSRQRKKEEWERENSLLFCLRRSPDHGTVNVVFVDLKIILNIYRVF